MAEAGPSGLIRPDETPGEGRKEPRACTAQLRAPQGGDDLGLQPQARQEALPSLRPAARDHQALPPSPRPGIVTHSVCSPDNRKRHPVSEHATHSPSDCSPPGRTENERVWGPRLGFWASETICPPWSSRPTHAGSESRLLPLQGFLCHEGTQRGHPHAPRPPALLQRAASPPRETVNSEQGVWILTSSSLHRTHKETHDGNSGPSHTGSS